MLFQTIRYINNGEPLDQVTLNRDTSDIQTNLEEIITRLTTVEGDNRGEVGEIPNTLVLRNNHGTSSFSAPTIGTHPLRPLDVIASLTSNSTTNPLAAAMAGSILQQTDSKINTLQSSVDSDITDIENIVNQLQNEVSIDHNFGSGTSSSGWFRIGPMLFQWGWVNRGSHTFPRSFSTVYGVLATPNRTGGDSGVGKNNVYVSRITNNGFRIRLGGYEEPAVYFAFGLY